MAGADDGQERTHQPTERRKQQFRERGEVPRSREVAAALGLAASLATVLWTLGPAGQRIQEAFVRLWSGTGTPDMDMAGALATWDATLRDLAGALVLPLGLLFVAGLVSGLAQNQGNIPKEPLKIRWEALDLASKAQQLFLSAQPWVELAKGLVKLGLVSLLAWLAVRDRLEALPNLAALPPAQLLREMADLGLAVAYRVLPLAIVIAVADWGWEWWRLQEKMRMTTQEVKEEHRETEGDPHVKAARKVRARQIAAARAVRDVRKADLVITNPTHYAVALRYRPEESPAPVVVARGVDHLAERIKAEAARHDIPRVENRPLARGLYAKAREGRPIPEEFYGPVARVLASVLKRRRKPVPRARR